MKFTSDRMTVRADSIHKWFFACLLISCCALQPTLAQQKPDQILVYGDGFMFSVKEPSGWNANTENAYEYGANLLLFEAGQSRKSDVGLIRVRIDSKEDENTETDMKADMAHYRKQYPRVQFKELVVSHPQYRCLGKVFYIPGEFYEYVTYVNPGPKKQLLFSVAMNSGKSEASPTELEAFRAAVKSLNLF